MPALTISADQLSKAINRLRPLPATARKLIAAMSGEEASLTEIARLIEFDQAIAAGVLRIAQSAAFAGMQGTQTVQEAVMRVGTSRLLNLVLGDYMKSLKVDAGLYDLGQDDLWAHGAASELAVRALMQERPRLKIPPSAQTAALLHDIGKLVMCQCYDVDVRALLGHAQQRGVTFVDAERELLGTDHAAIGGAVATHWQFPVEIADAIQRHHVSDLGESNLVLDAVVVANLVAKTIEVGLGAEGLNFPVDASVFRRLSIDFSTFGRICLQTDQWLRELRH